MTLSDRIALVAFGIGCAAQLLAGVVWFLRRTRGLTPAERLGALGNVLRRGLRRTIPSRRAVEVLGVGGFLGGALALGGAHFGLLYWYASTLPRYTEAYEGVGDALLLQFYAYLSLCLTAVLAFGCGIASAYWADARKARR